MRSALLFVAVVALGGCGAAVTRTVTRTAPAAGAGLQLARSSANTLCSVYAVGHDAEVTFSSGALQVAPLCADWIRKQGAAGAYWSENAPAMPAMVSPICRLSYGRVFVLVEDSGGAFMGSQACAGLAAAGWQ